MTEQQEPDHGVEFTFGIGERPDGTICVTMGFTTCGISTTGIVLTPDMAEAMAPQLEKELINASKAARKEQRRRVGEALSVVSAIPEALRKGH